MSFQTIKKILTKLSRRYPEVVRTQLKEGDCVQKSAERAYEIDDVHIYQRLGNFEKGVIPYTRIYYALHSSQQTILSLFNGSSTIPFSRAVRSHAGECLEKAILVQLAAQTGRDSFLINGSMQINDKNMTPYAYNIVFKEGMPYLVDTHYPLKITESRKEPFIVPIIEIRKKEFILPSHLKTNEGTIKLNRHYTLA